MRARICHLQVRETLNESMTKENIMENGLLCKLSKMKLSNNNLLSSDKKGKIKINEKSRKGEIKNGLIRVCPPKIDQL